MFVRKCRLKIAVPALRKDAVKNYLNALRGIGAVPSVVDAEVCAEDFDGLLLPGGGDVHPSRYGQEIDGSEIINEALDALQFAALDRFIRMGKPVFGICRGHQILNIYFGGTLIQDIETTWRHKRGEDNLDKVHMSTAVPGSWLAEIYGTEFPVNSSHHQALDRLGDGFEIVQRAEEGIVEAMNHRSLPIWSVQWHPERMCFAHARKDTVDGSLVLRYFLEKCAEKQKKGKKTI